MNAVENGGGMMLKSVLTEGGIKASRLLVVDDEPVNVKLLERMLKADGYGEIVSTLDPREVEGIYRERRPDLILLDLNMPYLDGFAVMARLREIGGGRLPPILVLTAQQMPEYRRRALEEGARDYVTKPFDRVELLMRVRNLLEISLSQRALERENELLEGRVRERTRELHDTRLQVIRRLGRAAEYRDNETGLHIVRMSRIATVLGEALGMDEAQRDLLLNASPMHDIGKIAIPDHILKKPGPLTDDEYALMKSHTLAGAELLDGDDSALMSMAREIALTHHERWDGRGYPHGLSGEAIPLSGRICAVADVFDALTSTRPYKEAWPAERAVAVIEEEAGAQFDPGVVEVFSERLPEILELSAEFADRSQAA